MIKRLLLATLMLVASLSAKDAWHPATVVSTEFEENVPAGDYPGQKKGVRYVLRTDSNEYVAYEVGTTVYSNYRPVRAEAGSAVEFFIHRNRLTIKVGEKQHKLWLHRTAKRPGVE